MTEPLHCRECDDISCLGFTTPRATPEPVPPPRPVNLATDEQRRQHLTTIRETLGNRSKG